MPTPMSFDTKTRANPLIDELMASNPMDSGMAANSPLPTGITPNQYEAELSAVESAIATIREGDPSMIADKVSALESAVTALKQKVQANDTAGATTAEF